MIRQRTQKHKNITEDKLLDVKSVGDDGTGKFVPDPGQVKSFAEQAIEVLNILDSKGIDIYDPKRTPGMYLKRRNTSLTNVNQQTIEKILHGSSESESSVSSTISTNQPQQSILDFLAKKK